jgi:2-iminobutanoate/2-iminopropanoate deaminase
MKKVIYTPNAPAPIGPYSQAIQFGNTLFVSGQIALDPDTGALQNEDIATETNTVMKNLKAIVEAAGFEMLNVVKCGIFLSDMAHFTVVNDIYGSYFSEMPPARETVAVKTLPKSVNVEISCIAMK